MEQKKRVIALGFFDGVHLGHGALLETVARQAALMGAVPAAVTFDTHPDQLILHQPVPLITSPPERADLMRRLYGIEDIIVVPFDQHMMHMPWQEFLEEFLIQDCGAVHLVAGHDFHFGYRGEGNPQRLQQRCSELGIGCDIIPEVAKDGITISSTYIRTLIAQGEMERAAAFLGHPYTLIGSVHHGKQLGRRLGFPTVNLLLPEGVVVPAFGVYATRAYLPDGQVKLGVTNVGVRPTVDENDGRVTVEGFLLDFDGDLYWHPMRMEFFKYLRGEQKFPSLQALSEEIGRNVEQTRDYFRRRG